LNKKLFFLIVPLFNIVLFASEAKEAIELAKKYEKNDDIKNAMKQYKKAALMPVKPKGDNIEDGDIVTFRNNIIKSYDNNKTNETIKQIIYSSFNIESYRINYLLPLTYDNQKHIKHDGYRSRKSVETKFQISFKKGLFKNILDMDDKLFLAYTQTSWWQTLAPSAPFRETSYTPELFLDIPFKSTKSVLKSYRIGLVHQSNGKLNNSRSWNRVYMSGIFHYKGIFFEPRVWYRFKENEKKDINHSKGDDNPDILHYLGYGDMVVSYQYKEHLFSSTIRKKSIQFDWTFNLFGLKDMYGYLQIFSGYGESLIDYNKRVERVGIGFAITR